MKKKKVIEIFIVILIICLFVLLILLFNLIILNKSAQIDEKNTIDESIISENNSKINIIKDNTDINNYNGNIVISEDETDDRDKIAQYNDFDVDIINIPDDVLMYIEHISNEDEFNTAIKDYIYKNGLFVNKDKSTINKVIAEYEKYAIQEETDRLAILFKLDDGTNKLRAILDFNDCSIEISSY